jgi:hypothetical protein
LGRKSYSNKRSGDNKSQIEAVMSRTKDRSGISRVYFIGAGLSAGLHYPVGRDLMKRLVGYLRGDRQSEELEEYEFTNSLLSNSSHRKRAFEILKVIRRVLETYFALSLDTIDQVDIAEFFTMAYTLSESPWLIQEISDGNIPALHATALTENPSESSLFADLSAVTRSYFNDIGVMLPLSGDIEGILGYVRPKKDAIINFNWDEEVDLALSATPRDVAYSVGAWQKEGGYLNLKPHGSIGWYDVKQGIGNSDAYFIAGADKRISRANQRILSYVENELPVDIDGETPHSPLACPPVITSPTFAKRFEYAEQHIIWQDVLKVCREAGEFIFLGYSLPKDDFLTRAAIRSAIRSKKEKNGIKCLVVDNSFDEVKLLNFQSVFEGFTRKNNYHNWTFGCGKTSLVDEVKEKLREAILLG